MKLFPNWHSSFFQLHTITEMYTHVMKMLLNNRCFEFHRIYRKKFIFFFSSSMWLSFFEKHAEEFFFNTFVEKVVKSKNPHHDHPPNTKKWYLQCVWCVFVFMWMFCGNVFTSRNPLTDTPMLYWFFVVYIGQRDRFYILCKFNIPHF